MTQIVDHSPPGHAVRWDCAGVRNFVFFLGAAVLLCVWLESFRVALVVRNSNALAGTSWTQRLSPFLIGLRFDLATACYLLAPLAVLVQIPPFAPARRRLGRGLLFAAIIFFVGCGSLLLLAELEFFREFGVRLNRVALQYLDHPGTVAGMIWSAYPVLTYAMIWLAACASFAVALRWWIRRAYGVAPPARPAMTTAAKPTRSAGLVRIAIDLAWFVLLIGALVVGIRGGLQSTPLRWGDAFRDPDVDAVNQFSLNGLYCIGRTVGDGLVRHRAADDWTRRLPPAEAVAGARRLVLDDDETLTAPETSTVLRTGEDRSERWLKLKPGVRRPNVVIVLMESFSARMSAAISGGYEGRGYTPEFDRISADGILFTRAFSVGTHTHQGIFGTMLSFPNLPGYEALMQSGEANQSFTSLPSIFADQGYQTMFLYNGDFAWDNMRGFFRKQGIDTFIGRDDFPARSRDTGDGVWGVTDHELLARANDEFDAAARRGPFFALVLTLSNHSPFILPDPLPFPAEEARGQLDARRLNAVRYGDWAIGQFVDEARGRAYFRDTVFVFVGDHGFHMEPKLTAADLLFHHVAMLVYGPGVLETPPSRQDFPVGQLNVAPSLLGLLDIDVPRAFWARDVFTKDGRAGNLAVFKSSAGDDVLAVAGRDRVIVLDERARPRIYGYDLGPAPAAWELTDVESTAERARLRGDLLGLVQSALIDLRRMRAGK